MPLLWVGLLAALWLLAARPLRAQQTTPAPSTAAPTPPAAVKVALPAAPEPGPPSTRRCRYLRLVPGRDTTSFALSDTLTIVPASVVADGQSVAYDARLDRYQLVRPAPRDSLGAPRPDSVLLCYRVLPLPLLRARYRRPRGLMDTLDFRDRPMLRVEDFSQKEQILSTPGISKTGNLSRGISFGNTQNVFVNSALNLQLEGQLTENIRLTAAISDQNVPFQPEGNTQTLQQFDKIYITLTGPQWNLTAGDVVLRNKPDYFLRYYKNIQGAAIEANLGAPGPQPLQAGTTNNSVSNAPPSSFTTYTNGVTTNSAAPAGSATAPLLPPTAGVPPGQPMPGAPAAGPAGTGSVTVLDKLGQIRSSTLVAGGVAKGKFASIDLTPIDNVQGPYRLTGPNGEQFIIVLAGSERVYLDGRLQTRGFDFDYVVDYNLAEITFSPRHLITSNSRLKVDFEYSDLNYSRSLYTLSHYQQIGKLNLRGNFYQESDNPDATANLSLSYQDRQLLRGAGNVSVVSAPGADSAAFTRSVVQYNRVAQLNTTTGLREYVYVYARDSLRGVYTVRFTQVGAGLGSYVLSTSPADVNANGRVYKHAGKNQGDYQPVRLIPTPLLKQMATAGATFQLDPTTAVFVDLATSQLQRNRFDSTGTRSQSGGAMRLGYTVQDRALPTWAPAALRNYRLRSALDYEYTKPGFSPIDRYRDIEFDRNWSAASTANATTAAPKEDNIFNFAVGLSRDAAHAINYRVSRRYRPGEVSGVQQWLDVAQQVGRLDVRGSLFVLNSQAGRFHSNWARGEATVRYGGGRVIPSYTYRFDKNKVVSPLGDTIRSANYFDEHTFALQSPDTGRTRYGLSYGFRQDRTPTAEQNNLQVHNQSQTVQGNLSTRLSKNQDLRIVATYRDVNLVSQPDSARQRNILGKIDHSLSLLQNQIRSELTYSVQTGRELKRDFSFVAVPAGQGTHYYAGDLNKNGVQDKDEFLEAQTTDAQYRTYIKVYLPTNDYITAYQNRLSYRLTVNAPRGWREAGGWQAAVARFSSVSSVTVDRRTTSPTLLNRLSPFSYGKEDDKLLAFNQLLRNTLYFNRANPIFGAELTLQQTQQKTLLTEGFDLRNLKSQSLLLRRTLAQSFTGRLTVARDIREAQATYSIDPTSSSYRNFSLLIYTVQPEISYQPSPALRLTGSLLHTAKGNTWAARVRDTNGTFDDLGLEARVSQVSKRTVTAATHVTRVSFAGDQASVVALEVLQALRPGTNYTWNLNLEQRLTNGLNINVAYDGRKASGSNIVHTGRMQVAVLF
ncbi:hypothetical protein A8B98_02835 [Hymenobacter sp. UV11]|nr:hypothetical protein A8B98_02835 [Hymenobacter sp. UV11]